MRLSRKLSLMAVLSAAIVYFGGVYAEDKPMDIKACMKCQNTVRTELGKLAKASNPDWEEAAKKAKAWMQAANDIGKNTPPKGDEKSWKEQTATYLKNVTAVEKAVAEKDAAALTKALATFGASCGGCHSKHKPK